VSTLDIGPRIRLTVSWVMLSECGLVQIPKLAVQAEEIIRSARRGCRTDGLSFTGFT
jgi:hypothetical protein